MKTFRCTVCKEEKSEDNFYVEIKKNNKTCVKRLCRDCRRLKMQKYRSENRELVNSTAKKSHNRTRRQNPQYALIAAAKCRAKKQSLPFNLKKTDIIIPEFCPVLGIKLNFNIGQKCGGDNSPSIDRIIPELGYVTGNIQVISKRANSIKNFGTIEDHKRVVEYMKNHYITKQLGVK